jgi:hypothetical protein
MLVQKSLRYLDFLLRKILRRLSAASRNSERF